MLGPLLIPLYGLIRFCALFMGREAGAALKARAAFAFAALSDGGRDDDFTEQVYAIIRTRPDLLDRIEAGIRGQGFIAMRKRMLAASLRSLAASGVTSTFG